MARLVSRNHWPSVFLVTGMRTVYRGVFIAADCGDCLLDRNHHGLQMVCVCDPLPPAAAVPLTRGTLTLAKSMRVILHLVRGSRRRRQGVAHTRFTNSFTASLAGCVREAQVFRVLQQSLGRLLLRCVEQLKEYGVCGGIAGNIHSYRYAFGDSQSCPAFLVRFIPDLNLCTMRSQ